MKPNTVDVLLVEDDPADAELAIRELKKHRLSNRVVHLKDGGEALEFLGCDRPHKRKQESVNLPRIILLDIHMPKVNGLEVLQRIKSDESIKKIPVVILTSSNQHPDIQKAYDLGANSYIVKPLNFDNFFEAIRGLGFYWLLLDSPPA
jgi:two-component system response regulator